jgi:DNA-binding Lrp family transcriptional regulator
MPKAIANRLSVSSFRGAIEDREPGIQKLDPGSGACAPARNDGLNRALPATPDFAGLRTIRRHSMTPFFVQIKCELGKSYQVANALAEAEIASEIYSTAGDYDLLVKFYVDAGTDIGHFVNEKVQCIPGIKDTHTIITFKAFQA